MSFFFGGGCKDGLNWYVYCHNNPLAMVDPSGLAGAHFTPYFGWSHDAPQRVFGYHDWMDDCSPVLFFDLHATKFELKDNNITVRLWKGGYGILTGGGGEIGLYDRKSGAALTRPQLDAMGLASTTMNVYDKRDNSLVCGYTEERVSFWTTAFNTFKNPGKKNMYTENSFVFETNEQAEDFAGKLNDAIDIAEQYKHNKGETFDITQKDNTVTITWGKPEENQ